MSKAYKVIAKTIPVGERKGETVYTVSPVSYGLLSTEEVAKQISTESTATPADVKAVLDRYAYYVKENLKKGYSIQLLGFGILNLRFIKAGTVKTEAEATAKLILGLVPGFNPSYKFINGKRVYDLIPDKVSLVKYSGGPAIVDDEQMNGETPSGNNPSGGSSTDDSGSGSDVTDPGSGEDEGGGGLGA